MKIATPLNFAHIVGSIFLPSTNKQTANSSNSEISTKASTLPSHTTNNNYLKSFDTAVIAYHIMGFDKFE